MEKLEAWWPLHSRNFEFPMWKEGGKLNSQHIFSKREEVLKALFFLTKHVAKRLDDLGIIKEPSSLPVQEWMAIGSKGNVEIPLSLVVGINRFREVVLNLEWSPVYCRGDWLQPELSVDANTHQLMGRISRMRNVLLVEVAYLKKGRKTTTAIPTELLEISRFQLPSLSDSVFPCQCVAQRRPAACCHWKAKTIFNAIYTAR